MHRYEYVRFKDREVRQIPRLPLHAALLYCLLLCTCIAIMVCCMISNDLSPHPMFFGLRMPTAGIDRSVPESLASSSIQRHLSSVRGGMARAMSHGGIFSRFSRSDQHRRSTDLRTRIDRYEILRSKLLLNRMSSWALSSQMPDDTANRDSTARQSSPFTPEVLDSASQLLSWEKLEQKAAAPVLDLSYLRHESLLDANKPEAKTEPEEEEITTDWQDGHRWQETRAGLIELGIDGSDCDKMLLDLPQLLRLAPENVLASAEAAAKVVGLEGLVTEPTLLSFLVDDIREGQDYLSTMMGKPVPVVTITCRLQPSLLTTGIDAAIQQRFATAALDAASSATSDAVQSVVAERVANERAAAAVRRKSGSS
eukprot:gnl/TRDRNA2_/TRDRNA2_82513_c0_seq1.p1 gnl/TRDRNA2_/TRDRNA2_82513_c0~~gnl/TRDRNA2_/TRDRNA2_82513_c0_seq1.p1  ORF type:complete len:368 (+),score=62.61 gnl/TRDRNA2_/TRDRNA2_82513_c0_seq1:152-1255(+)